MDVGGPTARTCAEFCTMSFFCRSVMGAPRGLLVALALASESLLFGSSRKRRCYKTSELDALHRWDRWRLVDDFIVGACVVAEVLLFGRELSVLTNENLVSRLMGLRLFEGVRSRGCEADQDAAGPPSSRCQPACVGSFFSNLLRQARRFTGILLPRPYLCPCGAVCVGLAWPGILRPSHRSPRRGLR